MTIVYNPPEEHECLPPKNIDRDIRTGAIWKCECGDLFRLVEIISSPLIFSDYEWKRLSKFWYRDLYREYKDK